MWLASSLRVLDIDDRAYISNKDSIYREATALVDSQFLAKTIIRLKTLYLHYLELYMCV